MKCVYENCNKEALEDSNYCEFHKKRGGFQSLGRFGWDSGIGKTYDYPEEVGNNKEDSSYDEEDKVD